MGICHPAARLVSAPGPLLTSPAWDASSQESCSSASKGQIQSHPRRCPRPSQFTLNSFHTRCHDHKGQLLMQHELLENRDLSYSSHKAWHMIGTQYIFSGSIKRHIPLIKKINRGVLKFFRVDLSKNLFQSGEPNQKWLGALHYRTKGMTFRKKTWRQSKEVI